MCWKYYCFFSEFTMPHCHKSTDYKYGNESGYSESFYVNFGKSLPNLKKKKNLQDFDWNWIESGSIWGELTS